MPTEAKDGTTTKRLSSPLQIAKESIRAESLSSAFLQYRCPDKDGKFACVHAGTKSEEAQWVKLSGACTKSERS